MRYLAVMAALAAFAWANVAAAGGGCSDMRTAQTKAPDVVASAGGSSTPVVVPETKGGS